MKNIWKIFTQDMKNLVTHPFVLIIAIGLCAIPSLYAWFNIYSNWDPYANTGNIKIAVTNLDEDYKTDDGTVENMGNEVIEELKQKDSIGWVFLDSQEEALEGLNRGDYYAAVVIEKNFTKECIMFSGKKPRILLLCIMRMKRKMQLERRLRILQFPV